jgi:ribosomal protein S18 acetylase RimI-like enzyme
MAAMTVSIRDIEREDAAAIARIHVGAWLAAYRGLMSDEFLDGLRVERWEAGWKTNLSGDALPTVRVAVRDGVVVGFCSMVMPSRDEDTGDDVAEVAALNVSPDEWRSGVGRELMHDVLTRFRRNGFAVASLWVVDGNERAQQFYTRLGFAFDGTSKTDEPSGARELRMRLALTDGSAGPPGP